MTIASNRAGSGKHAYAQYSFFFVSSRICLLVLSTHNVPIINMADTCNGLSSNNVVIDLRSDSFYFLKPRQPLNSSVPNRRVECSLQCEM